MKEAIGIIETVGLVAAVEAGDAASKAANITVIGWELVKGQNWVVIKIKGDVAAVTAAVEAAKVAASRVNKVVRTTILTGPAEGVEKIINSKETVG